MIGKTNSQGVVPKGTINITENGTYSISSYSEAIVSVSGLVPSGTLEISSNGTYDVTNYASASVNVQGGGGNTLAELMTFQLESYTGSARFLPGSYQYVIPSTFFYLQSKLSIVTISPVLVHNNNHVFSVYNDAFNACASLQSFNVLSLSYDTYSKYIKKHIGLNAFYNCRTLATPVYAYSVGSSAFLNCSSLSFVRIYQPSEITTQAWITLYASAFYGCTNLSDFQMKGENLSIHDLALPPALSKIDSTVLADAIALSLSRVAYSNSVLQEISLSNVINQVWQNFCSYCPNLKTVSLSTSKSAISFYFIGSNAFRGCTNLSYLSLTPLSNSLYIGSWAFAFTALEELPSDFTNKISSMAGSAFYSCALKSFTDNYATVSLSSDAMGHMPNLKYVSMTGTVSLWGYCFWENPNLSFANIAKINYMGNYTFYNCALKSFLCESLPNIPNHAFRDNRFLESFYLFSSNIITLTNASAFHNTPLANSSLLGYYGSIYVTESLYNSYITNTNWAYYSERFVSVTEAEKEQIITDYNNVSYVE